MMRLGKSVRAIAAWLRMLPAFAWLAVQLSMAGLPVMEVNAAHHHDPEFAVLFETLGEERIELCTPDGKQVFGKPGEHADHAECDWCQGFSATVRPEAPALSEQIGRAIAPAWRMPSDRNTARPKPERCHPCRAPPAPI